MASLTIVIPAYNEAESLGVFLPEICAFCESRDYSLIIVNDGSKDDTRKVLEAHNSSALKVVHHKVNRGYGAAVKTGIREADTDYIITMDADGQHDPEDVPKLFKIAQEKDADMVIGNRDANKQGLYRKTGKGIIRFIAKLLLPVHVKDLNTGMRLCNRKLVKRYLSLCPDSFSFCDTITLVFIGQRHLVIEEPIAMRERTSGQSMISTGTAIETVREIVNIVVLFNPMKIFLPLSLLLMLGSLAWGVISFLMVGKGLSVAAMLGFLIGVLFLLLGLLAEQLSQIRRNQVDD